MSSVGITLSYSPSQKVIMYPADILFIVRGIHRRKNPHSSKGALPYIYKDAPKLASPIRYKCSSAR